jgi:16S rRNA (guanine966-N2)-methyltransferase
MPRNKRPGRHTALQKAGGVSAGAGRNEVRIIGGAWRGRKIRFPPNAGLRPTPDRVRETLFNWLAPSIGGARCLDLFAGSGALGLEALSRGAAHVVFVEKNPAVAKHLSAVTATLAPGQADVAAGDARRWLKGQPQGFDIVFVDPPFDSDLLDGALMALARPGWLAAGAFVYIESPAAVGEPALPGGWRLHRSGRAGEVGYHLAAIAGPAPGDGGSTPGGSPGEHE